MNKIPQNVVAGQWPYKNDYKYNGMPLVIQRDETPLADSGIPPQTIGAVAALHPIRPPPGTITSGTINSFVLQMKQIERDFVNSVLKQQEAAAEEERRNIQLETFINDNLENMLMHLMPVIDTTIKKDEKDGIEQNTKRRELLSKQGLSFKDIISKMDKSGFNEIKKVYGIDDPKFAERLMAILETNDVLNQNKYPLETFDLMIKLYKTNNLNLLEYLGKLVPPESSNGGASNKIKILGRERKIYKEGRASYIIYKKERLSLAKARKLDKKMKQSKKSTVVSKTFRS